MHYYQSSEPPMTGSWSILQLKRLRLTQVKELVQNLGGWDAIRTQVSLPPSQCCLPQLSLNGQPPFMSHAVLAPMLTITYSPVCVLPFPCMRILQFLVVRCVLTLSRPLAFIQAAALGPPPAGKLSPIHYMVCSFSSLRSQLQCHFPWECKMGRLWKTL